MSHYKFHDLPKLNNVLVDCCENIIECQNKDSEYWGLVAACLIDMDNNFVYGVNHIMPNNKRKHAERVVIDKYKKKYGSVPKGSIIITTLSPCCSDMDERYGSDCTSYINENNVTKVYCGYMDPTQHNSIDRNFVLRETDNVNIKRLCEKIASRFL